MVDDPRDAGECRQRALRLLALRTHFSAELRAKLVARGFEEATVEDTIAGLIREDLVDDYAAGIELVETRLRRKALGPARLRADLARKGLDRDLADRVLEVAYPADQEELARRALGSGASLDAAAAARRLDRLGFSSFVIVGLVDEIRTANSRVNEH